MPFKMAVVGSREEPFRIVDFEPQPPAQGQARVRVHYTGVSFGNLMVHDMQSKRKPGAKPVVLGYEIVGEVESLGPGVSGLRPGERVAYFTGGQGGYTQIANLPAKELVPVPAGVEGSEVVPLVLNYMTAYQSLHRLAKVQQGQTVLFTGASGGVGTALLDLGRVAGLKMYGLASKKKHDVLTRMDATPIDYRTEDFVQVVRGKHPEGIDAAFDGVSGGMEVQCLKVVRRGGVAVSYGMRSINASGEFRFGPIFRGLFSYLLRGALPGSPKAKTYFINMYQRRHPDHFREDMRALLDLLAARKISPVVATVLPLAEVARAHELLLKGEVAGKVVLDCR